MTKKILLLAANPRGTNALRLDEEVREIAEGLQRSQHRDRFDLQSKWAVRSRDFYRYMLDTQPQIVHFCGHGGGEPGIALENDAGQVEFLPTAQLTSLFKLFASKGLECVVLNACYSEVQAQAISAYIPYVIGMHQAVGDRAAISFSVAFYDALAAGESVEFAFNLGCAQLIGLAQDQIPVLLKCPNSQLSSGAHQPKPDSDATITDNPEIDPEKQKGAPNITQTAGANSKQIGMINNAGNISM
jgi:CHAT domain